MTEARTGKRFPLQLPITIHEQESSRKHKGLTSNISASGVYFWSEKAFAVGSLIKFNVNLPGEIVGGERNVQIECRGRVVRADINGRARRLRTIAGTRGLACVIDGYKFIRR
ncbi:MAG TPA: PilZ domain-containing protein [Terriglobales bacterium]|nr:PilZ domain-containing protein [Terriglobales bacterium]